MQGLRTLQAERGLGMLLLECAWPTNSSQKGAGIVALPREPRKLLEVRLSKAEKPVSEMMAEMRHLGSSRSVYLLDSMLGRLL